MAAMNAIEIADRGDRAVEPRRGAAGSTRR